MTDPVPAPKQTLEELRLIREENDRTILKMQRRLDKTLKLRGMTIELISCGKNALDYVEDRELEYVEHYYDEVIESANEALKELQRLYADPDFEECRSRIRARSRSPMSREKKA